MPNTIFDAVVSKEITAYWTDLLAGEPPFLLEQLFPVKKQLDVNISFIKGSKGLPVALNASAYDVTAIPRDRIAFDKLKGEMPFFKESLYIDEETRRQLNIAISSGSQELIDVIVRKIFDDQFELVRAARTRQEVMRSQALTTGAITLLSNGQSYTYDYGMPNDHKVDASTTWADYANADPVADIEALKQTIIDDTGVTPTRAICNSITFRQLKNNDKIKKSLFVLSNGQVASLSDARVKQYIFDECKILIEVYDKKYIGAAGGSASKFIPDDTFIIFGDGELGKSYLGATPEESDLLAHTGIDCSIVDQGIAVTVMRHQDPVNVETKVSMNMLPSFPAADSVGIIDTTP